MLRLKDIKKDYKVAQGSVHALKGISLAFRKNEFVFILGPSGCGKTTFLNIIGGLDHYTSGDLVIQGKSTKDFKDRDWDVYRNHRIGFIFQSYNLIPHQTVLANVELALTIAGVGKEERRECAVKALERVGLGEELHKRPNQLSGGQMQRVAIARALVNNPDILLADEPTGALDSKTSIEVMELIKEIASERLVIMVTHNPELAEKYSTRIVRLKDGLVESDSDPYSEEEEDKENAEELAKAAKQAAKNEGARKGGKKPRAKMSFFTSLALSAKNLLSKKGRTIITSIAGSIGIISVCLVLALSSGFNAYIERTEEDMLSYYPIEITETTVDLDAVMDNAGSMDTLPDPEKIDDKVYVDSFLTQLAQGIAVTNNLSDEYLSYLQKGKEENPDWFAAIKYTYGVSLGDNLFTDVRTGGVLDRDTNELTEIETQYLSLTELREFYTNELLSLASEYSSLLGYVDFFTNVLGIMPGTGDITSADYAEYVLSQYDILDPETMHFPQNENEMVLVVGPRNEVSDLTLAQLGFIPEADFMDLFQMGEEGNELEGKCMEIDFQEVLAKQYVLFYNDAVYSKRETRGISEQPFSYSGKKDENAFSDTDANGNEVGIPLKVSAVLRLKEGRTYGCLTDGINLSEATLQKYLSANKESAIVKWMQSEEAKVPDALSALLGATGNGMAGCLSPSAHLNDDYISVDLGALKTTLAASFGEAVLKGIEDGYTALGKPSPFNDSMTAAEVKAVFQDPLVGVGLASEFGGETVAAMLAQIDELGARYSHFTRAELGGAVGIPLVEKNYESQLGFEFKGTIFISYTSDTAVRLLGGRDRPNGVNIYPTDFDGKENVLEYLNAWNEAENREETDKISYTDRVGLLMGMMQTMLDVITYVLVAFTSISLVVSSVMIGIITYVSVVERVKEIGVLRSLGARKMDIRNLFNAETFIIGLSAGLIGVGVTYLLSIVINLIIYSLSGIGGIASLSPLAAFVMVCVSVALTLISGLIPAQAAAKKDPVIALRTE